MIKALFALLLHHNHLMISCPPLPVVNGCVHPAHSLLLEPIHVLRQWVASLVMVIEMVHILISWHLLSSLQPGLMQRVAAAATAHMQRSRPTSAD